MNKRSRELNNGGLDCYSSLGCCDEEAVAERSQSITDQWKKLVELSQKQKSLLQASPTTLLSTDVSTILSRTVLLRSFYFISFTR